MPPVAPPVTTPMIHYHFLIVKIHQHGRLYQHHLFRFTPKVGPNEKMAPPSRAKGGAMTPVALPPPPLRSPVPRTSTYRNGPYESRQEKTDLPKTKLCCQTGPSTTSNYRGTLYVTTGTAPLRLIKTDPSKKKVLPERIHDNIQQPERATLRAVKTGPFQIEIASETGQPHSTILARAPTEVVKTNHSKKKCRLKTYLLNNIHYRRCPVPTANVLRVCKKFCKKVLRAAGGPS